MLKRWSRDVLKDDYTNVMDAFEFIVYTLLPAIGAKEEALKAKASAECHFAEINMNATP